MADGTRMETPLGERLDALRRKLDISWSEMDRRCGLHRNHLRAIAKSGSCHIEQLEAIRRGTGVNLNWLVCDDEENMFSSMTDKHQAAILGRTRRRAPKDDDEEEEPKAPEPKRFQLPSAKWPTPPRRRTP